jgi:uncharacterized protein
MTALRENFLEAMVQAIVQEVAPEKIILFGSRARGQEGPDSDMDLLIIERDPFGAGRSRRAEMARVRRALSSFRVPKDILVYSSDEAAKWGQSTNHILARSLREGKLLYERS